MRTFSKVLAVASLALAVVGCNDSNNTTKNGTLAAGGAAVYTGVAKKDGKATLRVSSSDFDPYVEVAQWNTDAERWDPIANPVSDSSTKDSEVVYRDQPVKKGVKYAVLVEAEDSNDSGKYKLVVSDIIGQIKLENSEAVSALR